MSKFTLTVKMGNEAMSTPQDVAELLERVAACLADQSEPVNGSARDLNGNHVARWTFSA